MVKLGIALVVMGLVACTNGGSSTEIKLDSIGKKFDSAAQRSWDSTQQKAKDIKEAIEKKLEKKDTDRNKIDSLNH